MSGLKHVGFTVLMQQGQRNRGGRRTKNAVCCEGDNANLWPGVQSIIKTLFFFLLKKKTSAIHQVSNCEMVQHFSSPKDVIGFELSERLV